MRKLAVLTSLVMVLALALPAAAQIETKFSGKLQTDLYWDEHRGLWAWGDLETKLEMSYGTEGAIRAVLGLGATEPKDENDFGAPSSPLAPSKPIELKIEEAYIQADGAWIEGLPSVTTKLGRFDTNYSDWVGKIGKRDGFELSNINLGPVSIATMYAWVNESPLSSDYLFRRDPFNEDEDWINDYLKRHHLVDPTDDDSGRDWRIVAVKGEGDLDVVNLSGVYVRTYNNDDTDAYFNDYAITASVAPIEGLKLNATFAGTDYTGFIGPELGDEKGTAFKVGAELSTIPNLTLSASVWASDAEFNPIYTKLDDKKPTEFPGWDKPNERKGVEVKADTTQGGFDLGATVKRTSDADDNNEATSYEVRVSRDFNGIIGSYKFEDSTAADKYQIHTVSVETTVDTPIAKAVNLKGTVRHHEVDELQYAADIVWRAPNGFNVGLHYASWDREDDWGPEGWDARDIGKKGEADGFVARVGYTFEF